MKKLLTAIIVLLSLVGCDALATVNGPSAAPTETEAAAPTAQPTAEPASRPAATPTTRPTVQAPAEIENDVITLTLSENDVEDVVDENSTTSGVFGHWDREWHPYANIWGHEEAENGYEVEGPAIARTEVFGHDLPEGVAPLCDYCVVGGWGVYTIDEGTSWEVPFSNNMPNAGGSWLPIGVGLEWQREPFWVPTHTETAIPLTLESDVNLAIEGLTTVPQVIDALNVRFAGQTNFWGNEEAKNGEFDIVGPAVLWTNFHDNVLPEGVTPLCSYCVDQNWGAFWVSDSMVLTVPRDTEGGGYISLRPSTCEAVAEFQTAVVGMSPQDTIGQLIGPWWGDNSVNFEGGGNLTLEEGQLAVVWTDWQGQPPPNYIHATSTSTDYGYGVFMRLGPVASEPVPSGGALVLTCD